MKKLLMMSAIGSLTAGCATIHIPEMPDMSKFPPMPQVSIHMEQAMQNTTTFDSAYDFTTTKSKITHTLKEKGMTIFAEIDHQKAAKDVGLTMQPATVIVFGTPKAGTPLMVQDPAFALQLPLKVLITEVNGKTQVVINRTEHIIAGSRIQYSDVENTLAKAEKLIQVAIQ